MNNSSEDTAQAQLNDSAAERYRGDRELIEAELESLKGRDRWIGVLRVVLFLSAAASFALSFFADSGQAFFVLAWLLAAAFLGVVIYNEPIRDRMETLQRRRAVIDRLLARVKRDWPTVKRYSDPLEVDDADWPETRRAVASDLDLLGHASLLSFVSVAFTGVGQRCLGNWLTGPADSGDATQRFQAASALTPLRDQRLTFYSQSKSISSTTGNPERFQSWATGPRWLVDRGWLTLYANVSALFALIGLAVLVVVAVGGMEPIWFRYAGLALLVLAAINIAIGALWLSPIHEVFAIAMANRQSVQDYALLFQFAEHLPASTVDEHSLLHRLRHVLIDDDQSAMAGMNDLIGVARMGGLKQSAGTFLLYLPLQLFGLWDVRVMRRLEAWQQRYGERTAEWFDALGQLEALMSIAAVHDEQRDWTEPDWNEIDSDDDSDDATLAAVQLGHPLLGDDTRVCNDVSVGPAGTFLLVTGSNMSGKSTLLRSIGLNVALAAAGSPVCARSLRLPSLELATSIRVSDSLANGVSFYLAELQRLKAVVDQAQNLHGRNDRVCLFLLDEILQGTNSRERQIAVAKVIARLIDLGAIGAISTHDLELADDPDLSRVARAVHFRETISPDAAGGEQMTFDYRMREGVSPTTNALRLLALVGLDTDSDDPESDERQQRRTSTSQ